jgi:hypothetical protein
MDNAHLSTWFHCLAAFEDMEQALQPLGKDHLVDLLDLHVSYGGARLQSLECSVDEDFMGSFAGITTSLVSYCKKNKSPFLYLKC